MVTPEERLYPGSINLPVAELPVPVHSMVPVSPEQATTFGEAFVRRLSGWLVAGEYTDPHKIFLQNSYYRDMLVTSPDVRTLHGFEQIVPYLKGSKCVFRSVTLDGKHPPPALEGLDPSKTVSAITIYIAGETNISHFRGLVKLVQDATDSGKWKIFFVNTLVTAWKGLEEEQIGPRRPFVGEIGAKKAQPKPNELTTGYAAVLIIGAGHCGLNTAVRLAALGIKSLLIERLPHVGDTWRNRYDTLTTHDPVHSNHMAYLNFPLNFPLYATKDYLGDWQEGYARIMGLEILTNTTFAHPIWDASKKQWSVTISRKQDNVVTEQTIHSRHIIQATGYTGEPNIPEFPGINKFKGPIVHSSAFRNAEGSAGTKVVIVGACNAGNDIALNFLLNEADVTVIQRSSTYIMSRDVAKLLLSMYTEDKVAEIDEIDYTTNVTPPEVTKRFSQQVMELFAPLLEQVENDYKSAGFKLNKGSDESGPLFLALQGGGGYHIDDGNHKYYKDGRIKVEQGKEIKEITETGIILDDGTMLEADQIILATGHKNRETLTRSIFGDAIADRLHGFGGINSEGEWKVEWHQSGCPGFWVTIGNMAMSRFWSRILALQIQAIEGGIYSIW
ncbi:hypothetical protein F5884DRAFT_506651 [Xylogone sp. PMI_703]|nr:hypothetical protein F5884DRAFT_506651 [Xylogone sp. PMI_703]